REAALGGRRVGFFGPPPPMGCGELALKAGGEKIKIPLIPMRNAVLTRSHEGRAACHYCGECGRGCETASRFCTLEAIIPKLSKLPNFKLQTFSAAHRVLIDPATNRARGTASLNTQNKQEYEVYAKAVVLPARAT